MITYVVARTRCAADARWHFESGSPTDRAWFPEGAARTRYWRWRYAPPVPPLPRWRPVPGVLKGVPVVLTFPDYWWFSGFTRGFAPRAPWQWVPGLGYYRSTCRR